MIEDLMTGGQQPQVAMVSCADSRGSPSTISQTEPGAVKFVPIDGEFR